MSQIAASSAYTPVRCATFSDREANGNRKECTVENGMILQVPGMYELPDPSADHQYGQREGEDCHCHLPAVAESDLHPADLLAITSVTSQRAITSILTVSR